MTSYNFGDLYKEATTLVTGTFDGITAEASATTSKNGKPMVRVKLQVEGGKHHGKTFFSQYTLSVESPAALRMFFNDMKAYGLGAEFFSKNPAMGQIAAAMTGKRLRFTVGTNNWQGVDRENVEKVEAATGINAGLPVPGMGGGMAAVPGMPGTPASGASSPVPGIPTPAAAVTKPADAAPAKPSGDIPPPPSAF